VFNICPHCGCIFWSNQIPARICKICHQIQPYRIGVRADSLHFDDLGVLLKNMENTPRNFALQLGALVALYASLASLITLLFSAVNLALPDPAESYWQAESAAESIRFAFATLVIFFPAYLVLTRYVNVIRRREAGGAYLALTRWLIYLSLLVGGGILLGDAVAVVYSFLEGELTLRFLLKAAILAIVISAAFVYYLLDARGHWQRNESQSLYYGLGALIVVIVSLGWGYSQMETPAEVRELRIDEQQITDLQEIQYRIENHLREHASLPETLVVLYEVNEPPTAPEGRAAYRYEPTEDGFNLCAEFGSASKRTSLYPTPTLPADTKHAYVINPNDWEHEAGEWCFERTVVFE